MASSSVSSDVAAVFALVAICILVLLVLRQYLRVRLTPAYLLVPVFLALSLPSSIVLLVPIDLASSSGTDTESSRGIWLPDRVMLVSWRIAYWLTFFLTWIILPLLGDYMDSGYREPKDRMTYSLRTNARYQLIVLGTGTIALVYFFIQSGFNAGNVKSAIMTLAYVWGLVLAIYLMGHGLVALPRSLIRNSSVSGRLRRLQTQAPRVHERLQEAIEELAEIEGQIMALRRKPGMKRDMQEWVDELYETSALPESRTASLRPATAAPAVVTDRFMAEVSRKVKRARHKKARFISEWDALVQKAARLQTILDAASTHRLEFSKSHSRLNILTPAIRYHLHAHAIPFARYAVAVVLAVLSILLLWSEFVHKLGDPKLSVVGLSVVHHPDSARGQIGFAGQMIAALWLLYMCTAALFSVSEFKGWGNRALVRRQTYPESACWYSTQVAKLTVPLSYNFITMMPPEIYEGTTFYKFLGRSIQKTPWWSGFSDYFPMLIIVPVLATLFDLYGKVKSVIGFGVLEEDNDENTTGFGLGGWREGRALIERELQSDGAQLNLAPANERLLSVASTNSIQDRQESGQPTRPEIDNRRTRVIGNGAARPTSGEEEEHDVGDRYFFQDFSERVKNTFDTTDSPAWLRDIGEGFKKPKWLGNNGDSSRGGGSSGGGSSGSGSGNSDNTGLFGRLFGGNASNGNIRL
ncbi:hypothetical protein AAFC00_004720 [Neodothiora populina]|uniref:Lysosomal cobalamin transporter n=1 Tax=Neodothiora populina TaxID=2781224 RepID=A0ABR3P4C4_9PEZI